jgi:WD40 repeat protein
MPNHTVPPERSIARGYFGALNVVSTEQSDNAKKLRELQERLEVAFTMKAETFCPPDADKLRKRITATKIAQEICNEGKISCIVASRGLGESTRLLAKSSSKFMHLPPATTLFIGCDDGCIKMLDMTRNVVSSMFGHTRRVSSMFLLQRLGQPSLLVSGGHDQHIRVWSVEGKRGECKCLMSLEHHADWVTGVDVYHTARPRVFSVSKDGSLRIWVIGDGTAGECTKTLRPERKGITAMRVVHHGRGEVALGFRDGTIQMYHVDGRENGHLAGAGPDGRAERGHTAAVTAMAALEPAEWEGTEMVPDGRPGSCALDWRGGAAHLLSLSADSTVRVWALHADCRSERAKLVTGRGDLTCIAPTSIGGELHVCCGAPDGNVYIWHFRSQTARCKVLAGHKGPVRTLCCVGGGAGAGAQGGGGGGGGRRGAALISGGDDQDVRVWSLATLTCVKTVTPQQGLALENGGAPVPAAEDAALRTERRRQQELYAMGEDERRMRLADTARLQREADAAQRARTAALRREHERANLLAKRLRGMNPRIRDGRARLGETEADEPAPTGQEAAGTELDLTPDGRKRYDFSEWACFERDMNKFHVGMEEEGLQLVAQYASDVVADKEAAVVAMEQRLVALEATKASRQKAQEDRWAAIHAQRLEDIRQQEEVVERKKETARQLREEVAASRAEAEEQKTKLEAMAAQREKLKLKADKKAAKKAARAEEKKRMKGL